MFKKIHHFLGTQFKILEFVTDAMEGYDVGGVMVSQTRGVEFIYGKFWLKLICSLSKGCFWITLSSEQKKEKLGRKFSTAFSLSHFSLRSRC